MLTAEQTKEIKSMPKEEAAKAWAYCKSLIYKEQPFSMVEENRLHIKIKKGGIVPFALNKAQLHILLILKKLWDDGRPIRLIVLKARQVGSTTLFMALIYAIVSRWESQSAAVIADEKGKANDIFEMAKLFQERVLECWRPVIRKSNERKLEFDKLHSQISIDTAENKDAGRSATLRFVLLSEYAYYRKANADALMLGISHSVPALPKTMIIKETTANGYNHFKDEWDDAVSQKNEYVPIFVPWYWDDGYRMKCDEDFIVGDPAYGEIAQEEPELYRQMKDEGIENIEERLNWRRWDIRNNCKGNIDLFRQENPSNPTEAFLASGQCFFDQKKLVKQFNKCQPPLFRANIIKENFKWKLRKSEDGDFLFYEEPSEYSQYCIGGDACSGSGSDFAALIALNKETNNVAVVYHAKCDSDELAYRAMTLGSLLNNCKVAIENDKFGFAANKKLMTIYGNLYVKRTYDKTSNKITETFGFDTNVLTRPMMLSQLQEEIREDSTRLMYEGLIRECLSFIKNPETGKAEAENGKNDDLVLARAIAGQVRSDEPYIIRATHERESRRARASDIVEAHNAGLSFSKGNK